MPDIAARFKYTVDELERMRWAIQTREIPRPSAYSPEDLVAWTDRVETVLRTYMMNGTRPAELEVRPIRFENGCQDSAVRYQGERICSATRDYVSGRRY
jgi:hypothetical protein